MWVTLTGSRMGTAEKAEAQLRQPARLVETIGLPRGAVEIWEGTRLKPPQRVAYYVNERGEVRCVSKSWRAFAAMLQEATPNLRDTETLVHLVNRAAPSRRRVIRSRADMLPKYREHWEEPTGSSDQVILLCEDWARGRVERLRIHSNYHLEVEDLGPGRRIGLR